MIPYTRRPNNMRRANPTGQKARELFRAAYKEQMKKERARIRKKNKQP